MTVFGRSILVLTRTVDSLDLPVGLLFASGVLFYYLNLFYVIRCEFLFLAVSTSVLEPMF